MKQEDIELSHFITPIAVAVVSTLLFFFLAGKLNGASIRYKLSIGTMLTGLWMAVAGGALLYIAMRIPTKPMTLATITNFAIFSGSAAFVGVGFLVFGVLALAWKYSFDTVEGIEEYEDRPKSALPEIEGDLAAVPVPAVPMYRTDRRRLEPVETDWPRRSA
ncbi:MAG TPA: hypothetical protein VG964_02520 [Candidatus Saccharimonadales bacterium]|nr:hypothetical protein [Candidatus Saccharimonadales bacterium]